MTALIRGDWVVAPEDTQTMSATTWTRLLKIYPVIDPNSSYLTYIIQVTRNTTQNELKCNWMSARCVNCFATWLRQKKAVAQESVRVHWRSMGGSLNNQIYRRSCTNQHNLKVLFLIEWTKCKVSIFSPPVHREERLGYKFKYGKEISLNLLQQFIQIICESTGCERGHAEIIYLM